MAFGQHAVDCEEGNRHQDTCMSMTNTRGDKRKENFHTNTANHRKHSAFGHKTFVNHCLKGRNT